MKDKKTANIKSQNDTIISRLDWIKNEVKSYDTYLISFDFFLKSSLNCHFACVLKEC